MKSVTPFPDRPAASSPDVVTLSCHARAQFDAGPLMQLFADRDVRQAEEIICRMLEDIALRLDLMQRAFGERNFAAMAQPARRIAAIARHLGLIEVQRAIDHVANCIAQGDAVALEATIARLERGFDVAVSEIWDFRDL